MPLEETLNKLTSFVAAKDARLACAAAVILAELAPRDAAVTRQLASIVENADPLRRSFIIEALGRIGTAEAAAALAPLIKSGGQASEEALRAIAHTAGAAIKPLLKLVGNVPPELLERVAECAARTGEPAAFNGLFDALNGASVDTCKAIRAGLRVAMTHYDEKSKEHLRKQLERAFNDKALCAQQPALIALMKIAGDLGDVALLKHISGRIDGAHPYLVRHAALKSLARLHLSGEERAKLAGRILPLMENSEKGVNLADAALDAIRQAHLGAEHQGALRRLLNVPLPAVREFAMQTLAARGSSRTINDLIDCLDSPDRSVREEALNALSRAPLAAGALCDRLLKLKDGEAALETARALAPQAAKAPAKSLEALAHQFVELAAPASGAKNADPAAQARQRAILNVFRSANSPALVEAVFPRARKLRLKGEPLAAGELLKTVNGLAGWNDEQRIELALCGLASAPRDLSRSARGNDPHLRALEEVLSSGRKQPKELARAILKDDSIARKTAYYLGFHFVERMQNEREFGKLLLEELAGGRNDDAKQAREKLIIEGLLNVKGGKAGILEERAKALLAADEIARQIKPREVKKPKPKKSNSKVKKKSRR